MLSAQVHGEGGRVLVDEAAEAARHFLASEVSLEMRLHVILARHLLVAQQTQELGLPAPAHHRLRAAFKGRNPWKREDTGWGVIGKQWLVPTHIFSCATHAKSIPTGV